MNDNLRIVDRLVFRLNHKNYYIYYEMGFEIIQFEYCYNVDIPIAVLK